MIAEHDGRALMGRGVGWPEGRYSALAGFVEPGESIEEAVAREVQEEAGVLVRKRPLRRQSAVAVPVAADDGLHRAKPSTTRSTSISTNWKTPAGSPAIRSAPR